MAEQLSMPWGRHPAGRPKRRERQDAPGAGRPSHRRPRPVANRAVRGEPDVPERPERGDWRIDQRTRLAGLRGLARARAALAATGRSDEVDAA